MIYLQGVCNNSKKKKKKKFMEWHCDLEFSEGFEQIRTVNRPRLYFTVIFCTFENPNPNPKKESLLSQMIARTKNYKLETQTSVLNIKTESTDETSNETAD